MGVSKKNRGTPKWMVYNGKTLLKWMIWGYPYFWKHPYNDKHCLFIQRSYRTCRGILGMKECSNGSCSQIKYSELLKIQGEVWEEGLGYCGPLWSVSGWKKCCSRVTFAFQKLIVDERNPETTSDVKITHGKWDILDFDWCRISCINSMRIRDVSWNSACWSYLNWFTLAIVAVDGQHSAIVGMGRGL